MILKVMIIFFFLYMGISGGVGTKKCGDILKDAQIVTVDNYYFSSKIVNRGQYDDPELNKFNLGTPNIYCGRPHSVKEKSGKRCKIHYSKKLIQYINADDFEDIKFDVSTDPNTHISVPLVRTNNGTYSISLDVTVKSLSIPLGFESSGKKKKKSYDIYFYQYISEKFGLGAVFVEKYNTNYNKRVKYSGLNSPDHILSWDSRCVNIVLGATEEGYDYHGDLKNCFKISPKESVKVMNGSEKAVNYESLPNHLKEMICDYEMVLKGEKRGSNLLAQNILAFGSFMLNNPNSYIEPIMNSALFLARDDISTYKTFGGDNDFKTHLSYKDEVSIFNELLSSYVSKIKEIEF
ncbi:hypothetical protein AYI68_g4876 [Smittium mucronatum]|uniref:Uncharacterized protein n=1 Tax=Smittium mucronatum TaxID=133383 RepID=A0A1R0GVV0_9FUNG|nr:hypothetical protein AYI68_g4876 [Smittium mucronatum]